jgi:hypothetical protein
MDASERAHESPSTLTDVDKKTLNRRAQHALGADMIDFANRSMADVKDRGEARLLKGETGRVVKVSRARYVPG